MRLHQSQLQQPQVAEAVTATSTLVSDPSTLVEAPSKLVALAIDRLGHTARLIADIRLPHQSTKPLQLFLKEDASMRQHSQDLRSVGRQLEESGVVNKSLRSRNDAVVAYAWKSQLVDRTRLALKDFTDRKRWFFPHLDDGLDGQSTDEKEFCYIQAQSRTNLNNQEELSDYKILSDVLTHLEKKCPISKFTYERLDWLKRASSLPSSANETSMETYAIATEKTAIIELLFSSIFRVIVSLHPVGSIDLNSVAFFSLDEGGSYIHARGISVYHVFRLITLLYCYLHFIPCSCRQFSSLEISSIQPISSANDGSSDLARAYHVSCFSEEA
ncbi:hypothetical protein I3843_09G020600 [Carya illinoinensis]|uniref:Uncharacterized protein n=1 Tax=Carya illinoinensis TaxID=32201 RepID=A0A922J498_CARIL|nr:hypothetical protein I3842_09G020600 [Carya illinoinensis]KAG7961503.1 hypothetical protein I3843_09G020600 [Carya illinoinensis]